MITHLTGTITKKTPTEIVIDVSGVGYGVNISVSTFEKLPDAGSKATVLTHHHIREDAQVLFGFATEEERTLFRMLISVSGIGPKIAQTILSGIQPEELVRTISQGNLGALTAVPGVGRKTAERLIVELKDKVSKIDPASAAFEVKSSPNAIRGEALAALTSLGFTREKAEQAIRSVLNESGSSQLPLEELIKKALKLTGK